MVIGNLSYTEYLNKDIDTILISTSQKVFNAITQHYENFKNVISFTVSGIYRWYDDYALLFRGKKIVFVTDNDGEEIGHNLLAGLNSINVAHVKLTIQALNTILLINPEYKENDVFEHLRKDSQIQLDENGLPLLPDSDRAAPDFPMDALPKKLREFCEHVSKSAQCQPDIAVFCAIGIASSALVGKVTVLKDKEMREAIQLYQVCSAQSGERKTTAMGKMQPPLREYLKQMQTAVERDNSKQETLIKAAEQELSAIDEQIKRHMREKYSKAKNSIQQQQDIETLTAERDKANEKKLELKNALKELPPYIVSDVTPQGIHNCMYLRGGRAIALADEGSFLNVLCGKSYAKQGTIVNNDPIKSGYNNRPGNAGRATGIKAIDAMSLSVCISAQPVVVQTFANDTQCQLQGLVARFLFYAPKPLSGTRVYGQSYSVPGEYITWWNKTVRALVQTKDGTILWFSEQAKEACNAWLNKTEKRKKGDLSDASIKEWIEKIGGNTVRVAGLLAMISGEKQVSLASWEHAEQITDRYFIPVMQKIVGVVDSRISAEERKLLEHIARTVGDDGKFTKKWRCDHGRKFDTKKFEQMVRNLCKAGYVLPELSDSSGRGRAATVWRIHPEYLKKSAP